MKTFMNMKKKTLIIERNITKTKMKKSTTSIPQYKNRRTQTENPQTPYITSSTTSSQTNKEQHSKMENASIARRKDISIALVQQGRFTKTQEEREACLSNPNLNHNPGKDTDQSKGKGKTLMPWFTT